MLFFEYEFLAFPQTIRLTLDTNHGARIQDSVKDGRSDRNTGKDPVPLGAVGRLLIPSGNQPEEQVGTPDT